MQSYSLLAAHIKTFLLLKTGFERLVLFVDYLCSFANVIYFRLVRFSKFLNALLRVVYAISISALSLSAHFFLNASCALNEGFLYLHFKSYNE